MVRRDPIVVAWVIGLGLAAAIYVVGPDQFIFRLENSLHVLAWRVTEVLSDLSATAVDLVRALSIGLFVTFVGLSVAVAKRGGRSRLAVAMVGLVFLILVNGASPGESSRWLAALLLSGTGAAVMTGRLRRAGGVVRA